MVFPSMHLLNKYQDAESKIGMVISTGELTQHIYGSEP